jgi:VanZ family protein
LFEYLKQRKIWLVYLPLTLYWLALFIGTSIPVDQLPSVGISDKIIHLVAYFLLAILLNLTLIYQRKSRLLFRKAPIAIIFIASIYGALDEIHQLYVPGRSAEVLDWTADAIGASLGVLLVTFLIKKLNYRLEFE